MPVALGTAAAGAGPIAWWRVAAALVVSLALQVGVNYANDYSDGVRGTDDIRVGPLQGRGGRLDLVAHHRRDILHRAAGDLFQLLCHRRHGELHVVGRLGAAELGRQDTRLASALPLLVSLRKLIMAPATFDTILLMRITEAETSSRTTPVPELSFPPPADSAQLRSQVAAQLARRDRLAL